MVTANCWYNLPVIPGMKAVYEDCGQDQSNGDHRPGYFLHRSQRRIVRRHASFNVVFYGLTTTIASSTTRPTASTRPKSESVLIENPSRKDDKVPTSETGTANRGMSVALQP